MAREPVTDRLVDAAFDLFVERGYEHTTVDHIAERADVGRSTFFRYYRSKEDVIFPEHDKLIAAVQQRLAASTDSTAIVAVTDAVRLVLLRYVEEGERARRRYCLTSNVAALRDREIASAARYQRLFREFIANWMGPSEDAALRAELMSAAVVAAHNHVLRRWLRGDAKDPVEEIDVAMGRVVALFSPATFSPATFSPSTFSTATFSTATSPGAGNGGATVVVFQTPHSVDDVAATVHRAIASI